MLHRIWQRTGVTPDAIWGVPPADVNRTGLRAFLFASELVALEAAQAQ